MADGQLSAGLYYIPASPPFAPHTFAFPLLLALTWTPPLASHFVPSP